jgi:DNA polymerase-3 subunit beta
MLKGQSAPALDTFKLEAGKNGLSVTCSDNNIWASSKCEADVATDGIVCVHKKLKAFLENSIESDFSFEAKDGFAFVQCGTAESELPILAAEFPELPNTKGEVVELSGGELKSKLSRVSYAASTDESRPSIMGVRFEFTGTQLNLVATDGRRLSVATLDAKGKGGYTIPSNFVKSLVASLGDSDVTCDFTENIASFTTDEFQLRGRLVDCHFPNYKNVIPQDGKIISVSREQFLSLLKRASNFTSERSASVNIYCEKNLITASVKSEHPFKDSIPASGPKFQGAFDPGYLSSAVGSSKSDQLAISVVDELTPVKITDKDFVAVVAPMLLNKV